MVRSTSPSTATKGKHVRATPTEITDLLRAQQGLITRTQVESITGSRHLLDRQLRHGEWCRFECSVYGPAGAPLTWRRRLRALLLAAPRGSLASHRAAAHLLGVGGIDDPPLEISIPRGKSMRRRQAIVHQSSDLDRTVGVMVDDIPTTSPRRLAMDIGTTISPARYGHLVREIRARHGVTERQLLRTYLSHRRRGRNGGAALRGYLDRYFHVEGVPESGLEQTALDALLDVGLRPVCQHWVSTPIGRFRLDFAFLEERVAVEVDGRQHLDRGVAAHDRRRTEALEALGWTVLRIRVDHFATDLRAVVDHLTKSS